jgi:hypothetical protein
MIQQLTRDFQTTYISNQSEWQFLTGGKGKTSTRLARLLQDAKPLLS